MPHSNGIFGTPKISEHAFVDFSSYIIGDITISNLCLIIKSSLRADEGTPFFVGARTNLQEFTAMHGHYNKFVHVHGKNWSVYVGEDVTVAHCTTLHGPLHVGDNVFIGGSSILWDAVIGDGCYIGTGTIIEGGSVLGSNCLVGIGVIIAGGVKIRNNSYIGNAQTIDTQKKADDLPPVAEEILQTYRSKNTDIVEINNALVQKHKKRAILLDEERAIVKTVQLFTRLKKLRGLGYNDEELSDMSEEELIRILSAK